MKLKIRFTIATKLALGFGMLMLAVSINSIFTYNKLDTNLKQNLRVITDLYTPSSAHLNDLSWLVTRTKILIKNWVYIDRKDDTPDKNKLREIHSKDIPETERALVPLVEKWKDPADQEKYRNIVIMIDSLIEMHQSIMSQLNSFDDYEDMMITFPINIQTEEDGEVMVLTKRILDQLDDIITKLDKDTKTTNNDMEESFAKLQNLIFVMAIILLLIVLLIGILTTRALVSPINNLKQIILLMGRGILPREPIRVSTDEIGEMANALNLLVSGLRQTSEFSLKIGEGNLISEFEALSEQDVLGNSLILMRENLKQASLEEEKRKQEDSQRSWAAQGLAKFSEILRMSNENMEEFGFRIISNLVKYLEANQGGFFIINDNDIKDKYIELVACYAYSRQKYMHKRIDIGITLVGQCVQERETIFLTEIPQDYIKITSGLGSDNPRSLIIVPLKLNEEVFGVVEIASFNIFEKYQIDFVEKLGESIASTISSVKVSINTANLLRESQEKSERLAQQEEMVRQNIEEMQATQDELVLQIKDEKQKSTKLKQEFKEKIQTNELKMKKLQEKITKQEIELRGTVDAINNSIAASEYNLHGEFVTVNEKYLELTGMELEAITGKHQSQFMLKERVKNIGYQTFWAELNKGISRKEIFQYFFNDKEKWFFESFTPVKDENGNYYKVISIIMDITEEKLQEKNIQTVKLQTSVQPPISNIVPPVSAVVVSTPVSEEHPNLTSSEPVADKTTPEPDITPVTE